MEGVAACVAGSFLLLIGEFTITIGIEFRNALGPAFGPCGPAGLFGSLAFFFVNFSVLVEVELRENFGQLSVTEGPIAASIGGCDPYAGGNCKDREVFDIHGSVSAVRLRRDAVPSCVCREVRRWRGEMVTFFSRKMPREHLFRAGLDDTVKPTFPLGGGIGKEEGLALLRSRKTGT